MIPITIGSTIAMLYRDKHMESRNPLSMWEAHPGIPRAEGISVRGELPLQ